MFVLWCSCPCHRLCVAFVNQHRRKSLKVAVVVLDVLIGSYIRSVVHDVRVEQAVPIDVFIMQVLRNLKFCFLRVCKASAAFFTPAEQACSDQSVE